MSDAPAEPKPEGAEPITIRVRDQVSVVFVSEFCALIKEWRHHCMEFDVRSFVQVVRARQFYTAK